MVFCCITLSVCTCVQQGCWCIQAVKMHLHCIFTKLGLAFTILSKYTRYICQQPCPGATVKNGSQYNTSCSTKGDLLQ